MAEKRDHPQRGRNATTMGPLLLGDRPLPNNQDAEMAVLGCMLLEPDPCIGTAGEKLHFPGAFFNPVHQIIFDCLLELREKKRGHAIDLITVADALASAGALEKTGGHAYLSQLMNAVPSSANIENYVTIVYEQAILRRLIHTGAEIAGRSFDPQESVRELMDSFEAEIMDITRLGGGSDLIPVKDLLNPTIERIEKFITEGPDSQGIKTGFSILDKMVSGLKPGDMFVLAARPSIGKTALALNMAANVALGSEPRKVGVFSLEMSSDQLVLRLLCSHARVNMADLRDASLANSRWSDLMAAAGQLKSAPLYIDDSGNIDILSLREKSRRMKQKHGLDMLVIDYLQLIKPVGGNRNSTRENEVSQISGGIKGLAKELGIPIIVLAQLNRMAEQPGQKPKLSHLRESGAIEQDADIVALLHRDRDTDAGQIGEDKETRDAELIIAKHRNGATGIVPLTFIPRFTRFEIRSAISDADVPANV